MPLALVAPAPSPAPPPDRDALGAAHAEVAALSAKIDKVVAALNRCRAITAAVPAARAVYDAVEQTYSEAVQCWAVSGAEGEAPPRDEPAFTAARASLSRAETAAEAAAKGQAAIERELSGLRARNAAAASALGAIVRRIELAEAARLFAELDALESRRAALRASVAALMGILSLAGMRGDNEAARRANDLRVRLANSPPECSDAAVRDAGKAWSNFRTRLEAGDLTAQFSKEF